ncbi:MAG: transcriptional coactivator p15/PC4 family protein [Chloroflexi bacterium]|nr:transcriptional coactivator p15/PC4 family protein [Chloroflexota bacterium]MCY3937371.1 transcriptional coactivator p15/PC4 family protein [Chloroflexota bacterium]
MAESTKLITADDLPKDVEIVQRIPKNRREDWLVGVSKFNNTDYAFARAYFRDDKDMLRPGKHGINVHEELLSAIINALMAVETAPPELSADDLPGNVKVFSRLPRSDGDEWLIGLSTFNKNDYAFARVHFRDDKGKLRPGKHGINVHVKLLPEIIQGLQVVDDLLTERAGG